MAADTKAPRPGKNSDGQSKGKANAPKDDKDKEKGAAPGVNPRTHAPAGGAAPPGGPPAAGGAPAGGGGMQMQSRQTINFKDLPPPMQAQVEAQQGLNPNQPVEQMQQQLGSSLAQGPSQPGVPNAFDGPNVPEGTQSFPDDMAQLTQLMQQGLGPGSSPQEHQLGINAEAIVRAHDAFKRAQTGANEPSSAPQLASNMAPPPTMPAPPPPGPEMPTPGAPAPMSGSPGMMPPLAGAPAGGPPTDPNAPGGIPPEIIAALGGGEDPKKRKRR